MENRAFSFPGLLRDLLNPGRFTFFQGGTGGRTSSASKRLDRAVPAQEAAKTVKAPGKAFAAAREGREPGPTASGLRLIPMDWERRREGDPRAAERERELKRHAG
jgi:hypothetical protein